MTPAEVQDLMLAFNKAVIERAMGAEMNLHLGYPPGPACRPVRPTTATPAARRSSPIVAQSVDVPRDRDGSFEPILIPKHERRFTGFDERIIAMYARGMSVREIQGFLAEHYGTEVSPDFISSVTDEVMAEALSWRRAARSRRCIRWCSSMRCGSRSATMAWSATRPCIWLWD